MSDYFFLVLLQPVTHCYSLEKVALFYFQFYLLCFLVPSFGFLVLLFSILCYSFIFYSGGFIFIFASFCLSQLLKKLFLRFFLKDSSYTEDALVEVFFLSKYPFF